MSNEMRAGHIEIPVSDPLRSLAFYRDVLGFALDVNQGDRVIWLTSGDLVVMLRPGFDSAHDNDLAAVNLVLYTADVDAARERLRTAGVEFSERAACVHFRDPDGHWLQIVDPHDDHSG